QRHAPEFTAAHQLAPPQVDDGMQIGDRSRIRIVAGLIAQPAVAIGEALAFLLLKAEMACRPRLDQHLRHVCDAAPGAGGDETRVGPGDLAAHRKFVRDDARLYTRNAAPDLESRIVEI